jgi:hypothetical protein
MKPSTTVLTILLQLIMLSNAMPFSLISFCKCTNNVEVERSRVRSDSAHLSMSAKAGDENLAKSRLITDRQARVSWMSPRGEKGELLRELLAGSVVALATIPTSVAYSTVIGLSPLSGIWSSAVVGLLVTIVGGGPGLIAGAAGVVGKHNSSASWLPLMFVVFHNINNKNAIKLQPFRWRR